MKITTYISVAAMMAMLAANTSCTKEETIAPEENKNIITLNVSTETLSRISLTDDDGQVKANWEAGDVLQVWARPENTGTGGFADLKSGISDFILSSGEGTKKATFTGTLSNGETPKYLNVVYYKNNVHNKPIQVNPSSLAFQPLADNQILTTELNEAPIILGGVFELQDDGTYLPVGGKMIYGGALFKITINGLTANTEIGKIEIVGATNRQLGAAPQFNFGKDNNWAIQGGGGRSKITMSRTDDTKVMTSNDSSITIYTFIMAKNRIDDNKGVQIDDYKFNIYYKDGDTSVLGHECTLKFMNEGTSKPIEYGKCYTVTLDATAVTAQ